MENGVVRIIKNIVNGNVDGANRNNKNKGDAYPSGIMCVTPTEFISTPRPGRFDLVSVPHRGEHLVIGGEFEFLRAQLLRFFLFRLFQFFNMKFVHHTLVGFQ